MSYKLAARRPSEPHSGRLARFLVAIGLSLIGLLIGLYYGSQWAIANIIMKG